MQKPNFAYTSAGSHVPMTVTSSLPLTAQSLLPKRPPLMSHLKSAATGVNDGMIVRKPMAKTSNLGVLLGKPMKETESRFGFMAGKLNAGIGQDEEE